MDTKWSSTAKAVAGFLAFFLGLSLVLSSFGQMAGRFAWQQDSAQWWAEDYQTTPEFRNTVGGYLEMFLSLGLGNTLNWGSTSDLSYGNEEAQGGPPTATSSPNQLRPTVAADSRLYWDKNLLFSVKKRRKTAVLQRQQSPARNGVCLKKGLAGVQLPPAV